MLAECASPIRDRLSRCSYRETRCGHGIDVEPRCVRVHDQCVRFLDQSSLLKTLLNPDTRPGHVSMLYAKPSLPLTSLLMIHDLTPSVIKKIHARGESGVWSVLISSNKWCAFRPKSRPTVSAMWDSLLPRAAVIAACASAGDHSRLWNIQPWLNSRTVETFVYLLWTGRDRQQLAEV
jgi:hypothetical protein